MIKRLLSAVGVSVVMTAGLIALLGGCRRPAASSPPPLDSTDTRSHTLMELVDEAEDLSRVARAMEAAGMDEVLHLEGPYTLFAPTNAAFNAPGADTLFADSLLADTLRSPSLRDTLHSLLSYHLVRGRVPPADVTGDSLRMSSLKNDPLTLTQRAGPIGLRIGGRDTVRILRMAAARNGMLYVIPSFLQPPPPDTTRGAALPASSP